MKVTATTGLLAYLFAVDYVSIASATTRTLDTNQILLKGSSNNIRTRGEELPTTHQQQRRRGQDVAPKDKVPKDAPPTVGDEATTAPDQNAPPPNKESKQPKDGNQSKDKKTVIDKKKETSKFSELSASNDCQISKSSIFNATWINILFVDFLELWWSARDTHLFRDSLYHAIRPLLQPQAFLVDLDF